MSRRAMPQHLLPAAWIGGAALLLATLYGRHGYSGADEGFITGLAWRVALGEVPHRDFISVRPPLSPLLHAVPLALFGGAWTVWLQRVLFYAAMAAAAWAAAATLQREFDLRPPRGPGVGLLAALGLVVSVQNFPPMPWHTVDGVLLGALGIAALVAARGAPGHAAGAGLIALAAATKQSFAPLAPLALLWLALVAGPRSLAAGVAAMAGLAAIAAGALAVLGALGPCLDQVTGQLGAASLASSGFVSYLRGLALAAGPGLVLWVAVDRGARWLGRRGPGPAALPWFVFGTLHVLVIAVYLRRDAFATPPWNWPALPFVIALAGVLYDGRDTRRQRLTLGLMLALAWCASLSWGYQSPVLFATPLMFGVLHYARRHLGTAPVPLAAGLLALALVAQAVAYRHPYREEPRRELVHDLGAAFPALRGVRGSAEGLARWEELRDLRAARPGPVAVLPARPAAHFFLGERPPLAADWEIDAETAGQTDRLLDELRRSGATVLIERDSPFLCDSGRLCSPLAARVAAEWPLVERGAWFDVRSAAGGGPTGGAPSTGGAPAAAGEASP